MLQASSASEASAEAVCPLEFPFEIDRRIHDSFGPPVTDAELDAAEAALGLKFPGGLRAFLKRRNGAVCRDRLSVPVLEPTDWINRIHLSILYGIGRIAENQIDDIMQATQWAREHRGLPDSVLVFARSDNDPICIQTEGEYKDKVYFWDLSTDVPEEMFYEMAYSYDEFLKRMVVMPSPVVLEKLPIFQSIEQGEIAAVRDYLDDGGKVDCRSRDGRTLLMCAARESWPDILSLLIERGADIHARDEMGNQPLYFAAKNFATDCMHLLLAAGADANGEDRFGFTIIARLADYDSDFVRRILLDHGGHE